MSSNLLPYESLTFNSHQVKEVTLCNLLDAWFDQIHDKKEAKYVLLKRRPFKANASYEAGIFTNAAIQAIILVPKNWLCSVHTKNR